MLYNGIFFFEVTVHVTSCQLGCGFENALVNFELRENLLMLLSKDGIA